MSRIAATLLIIEVIVVALAVPVAVNTADRSVGTAWLSAGAVIVLCVAGAALVRKGRIGYVVGSAAQVAALAMGFVVTAMFVLGAVFAVLWATLLHLGAKVEAAQAQAQSDG